MQTFLPHEDFRASAEALDTRRLGKQIMEARQVLRSLRDGPGAAWHNHSAAQMWVGSEVSLGWYGIACCDAWESRTSRPRVEYDDLLAACTGQPHWLPEWLGHEPFHRGHRGHLYRKDPGHYAAFAPDADAPLLYPVRRGDTWVYVERVAPGRFRLGDGPVRGSIRAALQAA